MNNEHTVLVCPRNDEESLQIIKIAKELRIPMIVSEQGHGAVLENEKDLIESIKLVDSAASAVAIVEIPGVEVEQELQKAGFEVHIIDHHRYNDLDRLNDQSSLEQFLDLYEIDDDELKDAGFDLVLIRAVAAVDRGFLWELQKIGLSDEDQKRAIQYIKELAYELGRKERKQEEKAARKAWEGRREQGGFLIIESEDDDMDIRDAVSYFIFDEYGKPTPAIIKQGNRKLYVQETDKAKDLIGKYKGFLFGGGGCWGMLSPRDGRLAEIDELIEILHK
ncbi:hypothetical protein HN358_05250 [Candidatus Uhrbacteria bacterium]|jgi:hypothetical protein|nr:hypothetical protein [Candidatus Uhrbacteria bacterium]MBT7716832.1 hypothetical protein [Candidatus Uhrbacteria bacterium]